MNNRINMKNNNNIIFGLVFFILFLIIGLYPLKSNEIVRIWALALSLVFLIVTIIHPNLLTFLNRLWIQLGILLGKIISPIVLGFIFFFLVTPIGLLRRILKKNDNKTNFKRKSSSYWINRKDKVQSMKKQY